jgi:hypothetical protein
MNLIVSIAVCVFCVLFAFFIGVVSGSEREYKKGFNKGYDLCKRLDESTISELRVQVRLKNEEIYSMLKEKV